MHQAAGELDLDLSRSYLVGDRYNDLETAARAGMTPILVLTGYGRGEHQHFGNTWKVKQALVAPHLLDAAAWIIEDLASITGGEGQGA